MGDTEMGLPYIKSIRLRTRTLTQHGIEVIKRRGATHQETIVLDRPFERGIEFTF